MGVAPTLLEAISSIFFIVLPVYLYDDGTIYLTSSYTAVSQLQDKIHVATSKQTVLKHIKKMWE